MPVSQEAAGQQTASCDTCLCYIPQRYTDKLEAAPRRQQSLNMSCCRWALRSAATREARALSQACAPPVSALRRLQHSL